MLTVVFYGLVFGTLGAGLGGIIGSFFGKAGEKPMAALLSASGGVMIAVVCFDLVPESLAIAGVPLTLSAVFLGALAVLLAGDFIGRRRSPAAPAAHTTASHTPPTASANGGMLRAGIAIGIAMAIHNFPEGLAIGGGEALNKGFVLAVLIALHDVPEWIIMAIPLRAGGLSAPRVIAYAFLSGLPTAIGAVIGYLAGFVSPFLVATSLALAGGAMLYVTLGEVFGRSRDLNPGRLPALAAIAGIAAGVVLLSFF
jgi:ZIP family zinc transporter